MQCPSTALLVMWRFQQCYCIGLGLAHADGDPFCWSFPGTVQVGLVILVLPLAANATAAGKYKATAGEDTSPAAPMLSSSRPAFGCLGSDSEYQEWGVLSCRCRSALHSTNSRCGASAIYLIVLIFETHGH